MTKLRILGALLVMALAVSLFGAVASAEGVQPEGVLVMDSQQATGPPATEVFVQQQLAVQDQQIMVITLFAAETSAVQTSADERIVTVTMKQALDNAVIANITNTGTSPTTNTDNRSRTILAGSIVLAFLTALVFTIGIANMASALSWFSNQKARVELHARSLVLGMIGTIIYVTTDTVSRATQHFYNGLGLTATDTNMKSVGKTGPILATG